VNGAAAAPPTQASFVSVSVAGAALLVALSAFIWFEPRWSLNLQSPWFDAYQLLRARSLLSTPVTVVAIDDRSLARLGQWPWPRTQLADLVTAIERYDPAAIGIDIVMPESDRLSPENLLAAAKGRDPVLASRVDALPANDGVLAEAIAAGPVVLAMAATPERSRREPPGPPFVVVDRTSRGHAAPDVAADLTRGAGVLTNVDALDRAAAGHGLISAGPSDDVIRRIPLAVRIDGRIVPALAIEMIRVALKAPDVRMLASGSRVEAIAVGDFVAPTESDGELRIYYSGRDPRRYVSAADVLDGKVDDAQLRRKLVLIGVTGLATVDYQTTSLRERMPGSEIQAQVLENLYDQTWLTRPSWAPVAEVAVFLLLGLVLIWATPRWRPVNAALLAGGSVALPLALGVAAFVWGRLVFDAAAPAFSLFVLFSVLLVLTLVEAGRQRKRLERVVQAQRERAAFVNGELEAASRVQTGFLPSPDRLRGEQRIDLAVTMTPAREVGGDLYDFFMLDPDRLFFMIGDVAGKGLSASLFMAVGKALCKSAVLRSPDAAINTLVRAANDEVSRDNPEMFFVTSFAGILDLRSGELAYCNAGHENPYLIGVATDVIVRLCDGAGPPLCAVDGFAYSSGTRRMRPGEALLLLTDGVVDVQDPRGERYGSARVDEFVARLRTKRLAARAVVDALGADLRAFAAGTEFSDDVTVLALRWMGREASQPPAAPAG
jgi:adenylate cyclase